MTQQVDRDVLAPAAVAADDGEARWWSGALAVIKASAADTGGALTILEVGSRRTRRGRCTCTSTRTRPSAILEGSATFEIGDRTIEAAAGDYLFGPRRIPHRYTVGAQGCRMLFIFTPGGFEDLLRATSRPAEARTLPPDDLAPPTSDELERMQAAIRAHGCEIR